eukprot:1462604-Amphidinium_carterae.1
MNVSSPRGSYSRLIGFVPFGGMPVAQLDLHIEVCPHMCVLFLVCQLRAEEQAQDVKHGNPQWWAEDAGCKIQHALMFAIRTEYYVRWLQIK